MSKISTTNNINLNLCMSYRYHMSAKFIIFYNLFNYTFRVQLKISFVGIKFIL